MRHTERLEAEELVTCVGSKGDPYHNAVAEAFDSTFETELIRNPKLLSRRGPWKSIGDVGLAVAESVDWYNNGRLHGSLGDIPPIELETLHYSENLPPRLVGSTP